MSNIILQDVTAIINGTSRYNGNQYDTCHVEMILEASEPIPESLNWYIPKQDNPTIPPIVGEIFKMTNTNYYPQSEATLTQGLGDTLEQAKNNDLNGVIQDIPKLLLLSILKKVNLTPIPNSSNCYMLQYDYKLYPLTGVQAPTFEFYIQLPFDTLTVAPGGRVQCTVLTPIGSVIDQANTKGILENSSVIEEHIANAEYSRRPVVSFQYQNDPLFVVRYNY